MGWVGWVGAVAAAGALLVLVRELLRGRAGRGPMDVDEALGLPAEEWMRRILAEYPEGRYVEPKFLAGGGMARIFKVRDTRLDRDVAFKMMEPEAFRDPAMRERFVREARAMAAVSAPGLPAIYDVADSPVPYFVMQYLHGRSLAELREEEGAPDPEDVRRWVAGAARALAHAHEVGIVHRDVKPENLMVDAKGTVWVIDFGIARSASEAPITKVGTVVGTPDFLAPERVHGAEPDARMDVFSLAATGWFLLAGRPPYAVAELVHEGDFEPAALPDAVPEPLRRSLRRAVDKDPARRPPSMLAFAESLEGGAARNGS